MGGSRKRKITEPAMSPSVLVYVSRKRGPYEATERTHL